MLKWAVYGKKNQEIRPNTEIETEEREPYTNGPYNNKTRRSLDGQTVKKSKKPSRYQRRSLGSTARKNNVRIVDKENINCIGNTPNYYREGFAKKPDVHALKDVSNITPTSATPVKNFERRRYYMNGSKDDVPPDLPPTPPTYSRRVREAKKRKLEMSSSNANDFFRRDSCAYKSERKINVDRSQLSSPRLSHCSSEPSLNELSDKLSASTASSRHSFALGKPFNSIPISTTKTSNEGLVEIEYDEDLVLNCIEKPISIKKATIEKTTLPIFGHHIFMDNPLYFNKNEAITSIRPLKRTRKKSNEFESSFKSPSVDKRDAHTLVRDGCSPVSITPLSTKLAALRFSTMSTHSKSKRLGFTNDVTEYFPKVENPFTIPLRDEESSTEMENKFILGKDSITNVTESTVSMTQMGDITLEKMIEDIIKSTKIVKSRRRILNKEDENKNSLEDEIPTLDAVKALFVNPQAENKANLIKEAKYVNLSRENSVSPKNTPTKRIIPVHRVNDRLLKNLPIGCFILDDGDGYNEREVRTPDLIIDDRPRGGSYRRLNKSLNRSQSMNASSIEKRSLEQTSSESTPDLFSATREANLRLRRQRCIRRKKSTVSNESLFKQKRKPDTSSILTLEMGMPSPTTELQNVSFCEPLSSSFNYITPCDAEFEYICNNLSMRSNVSHSSLKPQELLQNKRSRELFGLTLENGIPSPISPVPNLKRSSNVLSEERAHKTSKLDGDLLQTDAFTPVIEHKSSRRCLTYSLEESINSSEEKRRSVASNRLERSCDRFQASKGTIDLEIVTRNDVIDVHGEW